MDTDQATGVDPFDDLMNSLDDSPAEATADEDVGDEVQAAEDADEASQDEGAAEQPEAEEIEFDGKTLAIPKGTPPELVQSIRSMAADLKADYTRKTQGIAETRRAIEARAEAVQQQEQLLSQNFAKAVEFKAVADRLSQFEQIDWQALAESDPTQATKLNLAYQQLQRQAGKLQQELQQGYQQSQQLSAQQRHQLLEQGQRELQKRIPQWGADLAKAISQHAQGYGFTADELSAVSDPRLVQALHDAMQWQRLQSEKPKAMQKVAQAPKALKPGSSAPRPTNQAALDRLKKRGRVEDLASLL